jgi:DNA repair exonuclease SbcCD ATPase subunit
MGKFVGVSVVLFVLAAGFVVIAQGPEVAALIAAFSAQPLLHEVAWAVIVLVPLVMLPVAAWLWDRSARQAQAASALEQRLDGVRQSVKDANKKQTDLDGDVQRLTLSDPEDAIEALKRRVSESERFAEVQRQRNESKDLALRVDEIRAQQEALKARLTRVLDARHAVEQLFVDLDTRQRDVERALAEIASTDDAVALDVRLKNHADFLRQSNGRCDQIEQASKTIVTLNEAGAELAARLAPFMAADDGITARLRQLGERCDGLAASINGLERLPEGALADRVQKLTDDRKRLEDGIADLGVHFGRLAGLRRDVATLFAALDRALNAIAIGGNSHGAAGADHRITELSRYVEQTQSQFDDIEDRVVAFTQLRTRLGELQTRLGPLDSEETGVIKLIEELQDIRDRLAVKIRRIEGGEEGDLAARVKMFAETKRELEERVAGLADQFTKLSTIRKDIAGLFDKLSTAVNGAAN